MGKALKVFGYRARDTEAGKRLEEVEQIGGDTNEWQNAKTHADDTCIWDGWQFRVTFIVQGDLISTVGAEATEQQSNIPDAKC